jgi:hypothetical protein
MGDMNLTVVVVMIGCVSVPPIISHPPCSTSSFVKTAPFRGSMSQPDLGVHWYESVFGNFRCCFSESYPRCHSYSRELAQPANPAKAWASSFVLADVFVELERGLYFHRPSAHASGGQDAIRRSGLTVVLNKDKSCKRDLKDSVNKVKASMRTALRPITGLTERKRALTRNTVDPIVRGIQEESRGR